MPSSPGKPDVFGHIVWCTIWTRTLLNENVIHEYINFIKNARGQAVPAGYSVFLSCFCMFSHDSFILHSVTGMPALSESVFVPAKPREHFEFMEEDVQVWIFEFGRVTGRSLKKIEIISKLHLWLVELWGLSLQYISATHLYQVIAFFSLFYSKPSKESVSSYPSL